MTPFIQGMLAGYGIAIPVGAIAILIVNTALQAGFWAGFWAGAGAATVDLLFASLAALAGQLLAHWLAPLAAPLRVASGLVLVAIGGYGLRQARRAKSPQDRPAVVHRRRWRIYLQFVGLTLLNPLTVVYFASLILGGGGDGLATAWDRSVFVLGAALASFTWQTLLAIGGAVLRRGFPPRLQAGLGILGNVIILGLGLQILFGGIAGRF